MNYKIGQMIKGFKVTDLEEIQEIEAVMVRMIHEQTGAELIYMDRNEKNMIFSPWFKTLPEDNTGVFHILEHTLLEGSKKYPVKSPFMELIKHSVANCINGMTSYDFTMYPVSTTVKQDFLNLVEVYLDMLFNPSVFEKKELFLQEGWRYELFNKEDELKYNGIVYNEMKSYYDMVDTHIEFNMHKLLYADTIYQYDSGGYPENVPDLTYEEAYERYKKFYAMSNCHFFLDGNVPLEEVLELINQYTNKTYNYTDHVIPYQSEKENLIRRNTYPVDEEDDLKDQTMISFGKIIGNYDEVQKVLAYRILKDYYAATNDSPMKKRILDQGLAKDLDIHVYSQLAQPYATCNIRYTNEEQLEKIKKELIECLHEDLNQDRIFAIMNHLEFSMKELEGMWGPSPEGLTILDRMSQSWVYGGDPAMYLKTNQLFAQLRENVNNGYLEEVKQELIDSLKYVAISIIVPDPKHNERAENKVKEKLANIKEKMSEEEIGAIIEENNALIKWQSSEDQKEDLDAFPKITLSDIPKEIDQYPYHIENKEDVPVIHYEIESGDICYLNLYFSLANYQLEDYSDLSIFTSLLGNVPTEKYDVNELNTKMKTYFGSFETVIDAYSIKDHIYECKPYLIVKCSFLEVNKEKSIELLEEILLHSVFTNQDKIQMVLSQNESNMQEMISNNGMRFALRRVNSRHTSKGAVLEISKGYTMYQTLQQINQDIKKDFNKLSKKWSNLSSLFKTGNLIISYNGRLDIEDIIHIFNKTKAIDHTVKYETIKEPIENITIASQVSNTVLGGNLFEFDSYESIDLPALDVASRLVSLEYIWNEVRVKGGAYGCGLSIDLDGSLNFTSHADPTPLKSIEVFKKTNQFLEEFMKNHDSIENYILSSISHMTLFGIKAKMNYIDKCFITEFSDSNRQEYYRSLLEVKKEDIQKVMVQIQNIIDIDDSCIVGNIK